MDSWRNESDKVAFKYRVQVHDLNKKKANFPIVPTSIWAIFIDVIAITIRQESFPEVARVNEQHSTTNAFK